MYIISWRISLERRLLPGGVQYLLRSDIGASEISPCTLNTGAPDIPPEVASRFVIIIEEGILPSTSLEQRRRNSRTHGTNYGVPEGLSETIFYGYIHSNLLPPPGLEWKCTVWSPEEDEEPASMVRCCYATGGFIAAVLFCAACPCP